MDEIVNESKTPVYLTLLTIFGWLSLIISSVCVFFMAQSLLGEGEGEQSLPFLLIARLCGIAAFVVGVVSIFNERWASGAILLLFSMILPIVSVFVAGSI